MSGEGERLSKPLPESTSHLSLTHVSTYSQPFRGKANKISEISSIKKAKRATQKLPNRGIINMSL
jgi:hypothetical protein